MTRVHEADAVPCEGCGAPLAVDVSAAWSWCRTCHLWRPVPDEIRQRAWQRWNALASAQVALGNERTLERQRSSAASMENVKSKALSAVVVAVALVVILPFLFTVGIYVLAGFLVAFEALETWAAVTVGAVSGAVGLGLLLGFVGACFFLFRRATRHRRWSRLAEHAEWHGSGAAQQTLVCCGECGAPLTFHPGEHAVDCGHCHAVVIAPDEHAAAVISLALSELQIARRGRAKSDRALLRARVATERRSVAIRAWLMAGSMALVAIPLLSIGYAIRALTPSLEEAMLSLAKELRGEFGAGLDPPFEWLDRHWIGDTPPTLEKLGTFASRWSIAAAFHGRPVLVSVLSSWTDLSAKVAAVVLACPRQRDPAKVAQSAAAQRVRAMGYSAWIDYAGIALVADRLAYKALNADAVTSLARAAYELAEER